MLSSQSSMVVPRIIRVIGISGCSQSSMGSVYLSEQGLVYVNFFANLPNPPRINATLLKMFPAVGRNRVHSSMVQCGQLATLTCSVYFNRELRESNNDGQVVLVVVNLSI